MTKKLELIGSVFCRLTVLEDSKINGKVKWLCRCECGNTKWVDSGALKSGRTKSCGCLHKEATGDRFRTHGNRNTRLYSIWAAMKSRCKSDHPSMLKYYKDRGITYCKEWEEYINFENDMKVSYDQHVIEYGEKDTSIDRIDGNKGYNKENCRWATMQIQNSNQRPHLKINTHQLMNIFLKELSNITSINYDDITQDQFDYISERMRYKYGKHRKG
jgi:hypothetical protein